MQTPKSILAWTRVVRLHVLFIVTFIIGTLPLAGVIPPDAVSESGLVSPASGLLIVASVNVLVIGALILTSRRYGWKLAAGLAFAYYGAVTFLTQIETWYFLSGLTVDSSLLLRLFRWGLRRPSCSSRWRYGSWAKLAPSAKPRRNARGVCPFGSGS